MATVAIITLASSCTTTTYVGPDYVEGRNDGNPKRVEQRSYGRQVDGEMRPTYDEELFYNADGKVIKVRQTEYVNVIDESKMEFIVWETEYKALGGKIVPWKLTVNGVTYFEIDYEILSARNEGAVKQSTLNRRFYQQINQTNLLASSTTSLIWSMSLGILNVPFKSDNEFVSTSQQRDGSSRNYLTLGFDNIVVKSVKYDPQARRQGISQTSKTFRSALSESVSRSSNANFTYEWKVIAGKICQTSMNYKGVETSYTAMGLTEVEVDFTAETTFDQFGNRTREEWYILDASKKDQKVVLYEEKLSY